MTNIQDTIQRFRTMTEADPDNELGHFSLGKALMEAQQHDEAVASFERVLQLKPNYSKAYELLAAAQMAINQNAAAVGTLKKGYVIAAERGDVMIEKAMAKMLTELGQAIPVVERRAGAAATAAASGDETGFQCRRCGATSGKLPNRPFKGELGEQIGATVCQRCWKEWIGMGTKVINELGLQMANPKSQEIWDQYMKEFLLL